MPRLRRRFDIELEEHQRFEFVMALVCGFTSWRWCSNGGVDVADHRALYGLMTTVALTFLTAEIIVASLLSSAAAASASQLRAKASRISGAGFVPVGWSAVSAAIALALYVGEAEISRTVRYTASGVWLGLVSSAFLRTYILSRRIVALVLSSSGENR